LNPPSSRDEYGFKSRPGHNQLLHQIAGYCVRPR
jgi:hypothetical protein